MNNIEIAPDRVSDSISYSPPPPISISRLTGNWLRDTIFEGDQVIDATMSNTIDAITLAKLVGSSGMVYSVNSHNCSHNLANKMFGFGGYLHRVSLVPGHYTEMTHHLSRDLIEKVKLVTFNFSSYATDFIPIKAKHPLQIGNVISGLQSAINLLALHGFVAMVFDRESKRDNKLNNHTRMWIRRNSGGRLLFEKVKPIEDHNRKLELIVVRKV